MLTVRGAFGLPVFLCYNQIMKLKQLIKIQHPETHVCLYSGTDIKDKSDLLYDGTAGEIDLEKYGDYDIFYVGGAADQPIGMRYWINKNESE